jgi:putative FmdB family regulatory protein
MPRYEYSCSACGKTFEVNQRMSDPPLTDCACGGKGTVKRLMSAGSGLIFKGSGFYITDYKNGGSGSASSPAAAGAAGKAGDSKSGESAAPAAAAPAPAPAPSSSGSGSGNSGGGGCGSGCGCAS